MRTVESVGLVRAGVSGRISARRSSALMVRPDEGGRATRALLARNGNVKLSPFRQDAQHVSGSSSSVRAGFAVQAYQQRELRRFRRIEDHRIAVAG